MIVVLIILLVISFGLFVKWRQSYWQRKGVPCLPPVFFMGDLFQEAKGQIGFGEITKNIYEKLKPSGQIHGGMYTLLDHVYMPLDVNLIKQILTRDFHYFMDRGFHFHDKDILTMNLFNLEGDVWKYLRTKLTPTFTSGKMKMMFETLLEKTEGLDKIVTNYTEQRQTFAIKEVVARFTTDIIASCAFGIECNSLDDPDNDFRKYGAKVFAPNRMRFWIFNLFPRNFLGNVGYKANGSDVTNFFVNVVKDTIKYREEKKILRNDFMHLLLQLKNQKVTNASISIKGKNGTEKAYSLSENEIIAQCFIFFLAGFETSSTTMTFALLSLARNPEIQEKLRAEIHDVLAQNDGKMTYEAIMNMPYLDKVVNETMRQYPPLPILPRICSKTYKVPNTDVVITKGTRVMIPVWGLHMDPEFYPNPEVFDPERFSEEGKATRPDFAFLPFGEGPRMCIGLRFGMMQTKVGLVSLLSKFRFSLNKKTILPIRINPSSLILSVDGEVWLDATKI